MKKLNAAILKKSKFSYFHEAISLVLIFLFLRKLTDSSLIFDQLIFSGCITAIIFFLINLRIENKFNLTLMLKVITRILLTILLSFQLVGNIDRSRSFYVISWVDKGLVSISNGHVKISALSSESRNENAIYQRILEQESRHLIAQEKHKLILTNYGKFTLFYSNILAKIFELDGWAANNH